MSEGERLDVSPKVCIFPAHRFQQAHFAQAVVAQHQQGIAISTQAPCRRSSASAMPPIKQRVHAEQRSRSSWQHALDDGGAQQV
jgi:hypothetical protein